jgi:hypothetical protein
MRIDIFLGVHYFMGKYYALGRSSIHCKTRYGYGSTVLDHGMVVLIFSSQEQFWK